MKRFDGLLQLELIAGATTRRRASHADLIGRSFFDGSADVTVTGVCPANPAQVVVERELDGRRWTISAGLVRLIVGRERKRRTA